MILTKTSSFLPSLHYIEMKKESDEDYVAEDEGTDGMS